jgi:hypothetical protein
MGDFDNSGDLSVVQTGGFVKGRVNRWSWLREPAMTDDELVADPRMWPNSDGDDLSGRDLHWRDLAGGVHRQTVQLGSGWHALALASTAQEVATR